MTATLALAALLAAVPPAVRDAVAVAAAPGLRADAIAYAPATARSCPAERASALRPVAASGSVPLRVEGTDARGAPCAGWAWATVRVFARGLVATRPIRADEPLAGAVAPKEIEIGPGRAPVTDVPTGATAARAVAAGSPLEASSVRSGPRPGEPVVVVVRAGVVAVAQPGRAVPCAREHACAVLPSGRRVEGRLEDGRIVVEAP